MKKKLYILLLFLALILHSNVAWAQTKVKEQDLIGNWMVKGGSGAEFDKEMIGEVVTFKKDQKATKMEDGEKQEADWKFENNLITITHYYNDGINDPDIEKLTITTFDGKKFTANYSDDEDTEFVIIFEKIQMP